MLNDLLARNRDWSIRCKAQKPKYFTRLAARLASEFFWIGCLDSGSRKRGRGLDPGEVFVNRNVANIVHSSDMNLLSALEFAVEALSVREIIVSGHYGCGGVRAATEDLPHGLTDLLVGGYPAPRTQLCVDLGREPDMEARRDRLAELNFFEGVRRVCETPILQRAWARGAGVCVHGLICGLKFGRLLDLDCSIGPGHFRQEAAQ